MLSHKEGGKSRVCLKLIEEKYVMPSHKEKGRKVFIILMEKRNVMLSHKDKGIHCMSLSQVYYVTMSICDGNFDYLV